MKLRAWSSFAVPRFRICFAKTTPRRLRLSGLCLLQNLSFMGKQKAKRKHPDERKALGPNSAPLKASQDTVLNVRGCLCYACICVPRTVDCV